MIALSYVYTFLQSSTLEFPLCAYAFRRKVSLWRSLLLVTLVNLVTHPIVFFGFMSSRLPYVWAVPLAEVFAMVSEMFLYYFFLRGLTFRRAFVASLVANLFSWQVAPVMTWGILQIITQT